MTPKTARIKDLEEQVAGLLANQVDTQKALGEAHQRCLEERLTFQERAANTEREKLELRLELRYAHQQIKLLEDRNRSESVRAARALEVGENASLAVSRVSLVNMKMWENIETLSRRKSLQE